jgi:hypothetical protein
MLVKVSVKLAAVNATLLVLAMVKVMVEVALALMVAGEKALVMVGATVLMTKHWSVPPETVALAAVMAVFKLVKAAGLPVHEALTWPTALVSPATSTVQLVAPAPKVTPARLSTRVPVL